MSEGLRARGVWKTYRTAGGEIGVLRGLDLAVGPGEIVAIVGVSGVGKSTLLNLLGGLDRPDRGEIWIEGRELGALGPDERARLRNASVGLVFQGHNLLPEFSAVENVMMPLLIRREDHAGARARALSLLVELGLGERLHHRPGRLSGGEQQRVAIGRALVSSPAVLLADEPTGNLDPATGEGVFDLMRTLARARGTATIVATHNEVLARGCDRVLRLCEGALGDVFLTKDAHRDLRSAEGPTEG